MASLKKRAKEFETPYPVTKAITKGDAVTKLSMFVMGLGNLAHKQIVKGILFLAVEIAYLLFMIEGGINNLYHLITLGGRAQEEVWNEAKGIYEYTGGDMTILFLLYGVATIFITVPIMNNKEKKTHSMKARGMISDVIVHVVLALLAIVWVIPVLWIALLSFSTQKGSYVTSFFPKGYTLHNYVRLFTDTQVLDFPQMFKNTFIIAVFSCLISTIFVLSVSYCMSRMRFKIRKTYMNIAMILGLFPAFMSMVAVYYILKAVGLSEGSMIRVALILVYSGGSGAGFLLAKGFFDTVPKALDEAAYLDGATRFQVFTKVTIPLSKPIIVYTTLSAFLGPWLDFIFAKVICRANAKYYTVALGLWKMLEKEYIDSWYTCFAAGAVCISVPIAILFVVMQRYYTDGLSGAVKG